MGIERYVDDDEGFRKYVELLETTPPKKRQAFIDAAKKENPLFVQAAEKYILTFERISKLPEMELAEVIGADGLKPEEIGNAILSVQDPSIRENMSKVIPKKILGPIQIHMRDFPVPKPTEIGAARLKIIQTTRELEKEGKLKSLQIPRFGDGYFLKKAA